MLSTEDLRHLFSSTMLPLDKIKKWSLKEQETLYASSYGLYERGDYEKAANLFIQLLFCNPFEERYWRGLASARQMQQKYEEALPAWSYSILLSNKDPLPHFHAAECLLSLGEHEQALLALSLAEEHLLEDEISSQLKRKIDTLKEIYGRGNP